MTDKTCAKCDTSFESTQTNRIYLDKKTYESFEREWFCPNCSRKLKLVVDDESD